MAALAKATAGGIAPSARQFHTRLSRLCGKRMSTPSSATWGASGAGGIGGVY